MTEELPHLAMYACNYWNDSSQGREQMRKGILESKLEHHAESLKMSREDYR